MTNDWYTWHSFIAGFLHSSLEAHTTHTIWLTRITEHARHVLKFSPEFPVSNKTKFSSFQRHHRQSWFPISFQNKIPGPVHCHAVHRNSAPFSYTQTHTYAWERIMMETYSSLQRHKQMAYLVTSLHSVTVSCTQSWSVSQRNRDLDSETYR